MLKQRAHIKRISEEVRRGQAEIDIRRTQQPSDEKETDAPFH